MGYRFVCPVEMVEEQPVMEKGEALPVDTFVPRSALSGTGRHSTFRSRWFAAATMLIVVAAFGMVFRYSRSKIKPLTEKDTIVLADFANATGDSDFSGALKTALSVALNQSPFLSVLSDNKVAETLQLMTRPANTELTPQVARELCQRASSQAYIAGSIVELGNQYVLELKAVNCQSGELLAEEQVTAAAKEKVLDALGEAASKLRGKLGESSATVQEFNVPLEQATTPSLEALKAYSLGTNAQREKGPAEGLRHFQRAIQLDPNFAMAYRAAGTSYTGLLEAERSSEYFAKAFQLRDHASERERLFITADYYMGSTGELDKAAQTFEELIETYPRGNTEVLYRLGFTYMAQGQLQKAADWFRQCLLLGPKSGGANGNLADTLLSLQRFDEALQIIQQAQARKEDHTLYRIALYALAFLRGDSPAMAEQQEWLIGKPEYEASGFSLASDTEAYSGHLRRARELTKRSIDSAIRAENKEDAATSQEIAAIREAAFGNATEAKRAATEGLELAPASKAVKIEAGLAFAMADDAARAESLAQDLNKRYPLDTQIQSFWLPAIRAQLALNRKNPAEALNDLQVAVPPIEFGNIPFLNNWSCLYPTYVHGETYLAAGNGNAAAAEFQKILDHRGMVWNCWTGALAHLGAARANALQAKATQGADADAARVRALAAYKDFLALWKDADPDIPVLKEAEAEYASLQR